MISYRSNEFFISLLLSLILFDRTYAQQTEVKLVQKPSDRFLFKLYDMVDYSMLPIELQHEIARKTIADVFSPLLADQSIISIPLPDYQEGGKGQYCVTFSPDSSHIAVTMNSKLYIINRESHEISASCQARPCFSALCFNDQGNELVALTTDLNGSFLRSLRLENYRFMESTFENGEELLIPNGTFAQLTSIQNGVIIVGNPAPLMHFSPTAPHGSIAKLDLSNNQLIPFLDARTASQANPLHYAINHNRSAVVFMSPGAGTEVYDLKERKMLPLILKDESVDFTKDRGLIFSNSTIVYASSTDTGPAITVLDTTSKKKIILFPGKSKKLHPLALNHDTHFLFTASDKAIHIRHIKTATPIEQLPFVLTPYFDCSLSPDGNYFALATAGKLYVWKWNSCWDNFGRILEGKTTIEHLLFIKFIRDLYNCGYRLTQDGLVESKHARSFHYNTINLHAEDIAQLKEIFLSLSEEVRAYLILKYFLQF